MQIPKNKKERALHQDMVFDPDKSYISKTTEQKYSLKDINLPYINLDSEDAKEVNKTISYLYMEMAEIFKEELNGSQTWYNIAGYTVYQTSDFLSVVINKNPNI